MTIDEDIEYQNILYCLENVEQGCKEVDVRGPQQLMLGRWHLRSFSRTKSVTTERMTGLCTPDWRKSKHIGHFHFVTRNSV